MKPLMLGLTLTKQTISALASLFSWRKSCPSAPLFTPLRKVLHRSPTEHTQNYNLWTSTHNRGSTQGIFFSKFQNTKIWLSSTWRRHKQKWKKKTFSMCILYTASRSENVEYACALVIFFMNFVIFFCFNRKYLSTYCTTTTVSLYYLQLLILFA